MTDTSSRARAAIRPASLLLLAALTAGACGKGDSASTPAAATAAPAASASGSAAAAEAQLADIASYRLDMAKYDKYLEVQRAVMERASKLSAAEREAMRKRSEANGNQSASLDDMARNIEREPLMNDAVRAAGLTPREFTMITMSMMQTAMAAGVAKMQPAANQDSLIREMKASPENVKFFRENEAEITRKGKALEADMKRLMPQDEGGGR